MHRHALCGTPIVGAMITMFQLLLSSMVKASKLLETGDAFLLEHNERHGRDKVLLRPKVLIFMDAPKDSID